MLNTRFRFLFILLLCPAMYFAKGFAQIKIEKRILKSDIPQLKNLQVIVNGKKIAITDKLVRFELCKNGIDTVHLLFGDSTERIISTHFKNGENYILRFSACSLYEIMPVKHKESPSSVVRIVVLNRPDSLWIAAGTSDATYHIAENVFDSSDSTAYISSASIGFCPFNTRHFFICTNPLTARPKDIYTYVDEHWNLCAAPALQFLSNERFTIIYDIRTKKYKVTFDGYSTGS